jgi:hypothetical protein
MVFGPIYKLLLNRLLIQGAGLWRPLRRRQGGGASSSSRRPLPHSSLRQGKKQFKYFTFFCYRTLFCFVSRKAVKSF